MDPMRFTQKKRTHFMSLSSPAQQEGSTASSGVPTFQIALPSSGLTQETEGVSSATVPGPTMLTGFSIKFTSKKQSPLDRLKRSRERNRMHARKTRQRKKEHIQLLQSCAEELKKEQLKLRQLINEKTTASILVGLFSAEEKEEICKVEDPKIEDLLRRPIDDIPCASMVPELPALILPGQHKAQKRPKASASVPEPVASTLAQHELPDDGIDYELLGKDRSKCSPAELDQIRRERNRMHAKRTRDRKRMFMEEMEGIIKELQQENALLNVHYVSLGGEPIPTYSSESTPLLASPTFQASKPASSVTTPLALKSALIEKDKGRSSGVMQVTADQIKSLLLAAGSFETKEFSTASAISTSSNPSEDSSLVDQDDERSLSPLPKCQRMDERSDAPRLPMSISTYPGVLV